MISGTLFLFCSMALVVSGPAQEPIPGFLRGVNLQKLQASPQKFEALYTYAKEQKVEGAGCSIVVRLFQLDRAFCHWVRPPHVSDIPDGLPGAILIVRSKCQAVWVESQSPRISEDEPIGASVIGGEEPILLLPNATGSNCVNGDQVIVLSLRRESFLSVEGQCLIDKNHGSLYIVDDTWERNPWLCHALMPDATIFLKMEHGKLVRDNTRTAAACKSAIKDLSAEIERLRISRPPQEDDSKVLSLSLSVFLNWRLLGDGEKPLLELKGLLSKYGGEGLKLAGGDSVPISEIIAAARELSQSSATPNVVSVEWVRAAKTPD